MTIPDADMRWAPAVVTGLVALLGYAVMWGTLRQSVEDHKDKLARHGLKIDNHETRISHVEARCDLMHGDGLTGE